MSAFGIIASNLTATKDLNNWKNNVSKKWQMCWACQKDKSPLGGHLSLRPGLAKFVCRDCVALKEKNNAA